jgi:cytochrome c553
MRLTIRLSIPLLIATLTLTAAANVLAAGSAEAGATKASTCLACHGVNGNSLNAAWPSLAGQNAAYLSKQLHHYHDGTRNAMEKDATGTMLMPPMASALSDQDIEDIAAYYALQTPTGGEADPAFWEAGRKLYHGGDKTRQIPACAACHGPLGSGNPAAGYPALRGQMAVYTIKQLTMYHDKSRYPTNAKGATMGGDNADIMHTVVGRLSSDDIRNLSQYVQGMR